MIFDSIKNKERYRGIPKLYEGLCYLENVTKENFPKERIALDGKQKFVVPKTYSTKTEEETKFEVHLTQADIHYMVEGIEGVQTADPANMELVEEFFETRDWGEYRGKPEGIYWLTSGNFVATFPNEAHKTGIQYDASKPILKAVYKYVD